jgi:hypothetical protein
MQQWRSKQGAGGGFASDPAQSVADAIQNQ